jgi:hypothetical protein
MDSLEGFFARTTFYQNRVYVAGFPEVALSASYCVPQMVRRLVPLHVLDLRRSLERCVARDVQVYPDTSVQSLIDDRMIGLESGAATTQITLSAVGWETVRK